MNSLSWLWAVLALVLVPSSNAFTITGVKDGVNPATGERPSRLEISTLQLEGPAFDIYILAMQQFMQQDQSDPLSYYQISGIHGYPYIEWDGAVGQNQLGYCPHGSVLFPTWHRVYLALFEQVLWTHAQDIASKYPESIKSKYQSAAANLRMPYWDWALNSTLPDIVSQPSVNVNTPNGSHTIDNPLFNYTFHPLPSPPEFPSSIRVAKWPSTVRHPDSEGRSNLTSANEQLNSQAALIRYTTYHTFTKSKEYAPYSNVAAGSAYDNIENPHNGIHMLVGGTDGHMQWVPLSAFDPVFWLHHTNIDRLFAMWQAIHPDSFVTPQADAGGTYTNTPHFSEDVTTFLTPFHIDNSSTYYNSSDARSTRAFGYTYPEILDWQTNKTSLASQLTATVNSLYSDMSASSKRRSRMKRSTGPFEYHYNINAVVNGSDVTSGMFVRFFLGSVPREESQWATASSLVGFLTITGPAQGLVFGQVPLTPWLQEHDLPDYEVDTVIPMIQEQLNYRVQGFDGRAVDVNILPSLKFAVVGQNVTHMGPNEFPEYGPLVTYTEATESLGPLGLQEGEVMPA